MRLLSVVFIFSQIIQLPANAAAIDRSEPSQCKADFAVQVLGSGGPLRENDRAAASYLIWVEGESKILIDLGPGAAIRFYQSGGRLAEIDGILFSHLHVDHSSDLPAFLKTGAFGENVFGGDREIKVIGPSGAGAFPGITAWLTGLVGPERGPFRYLAGYLNGGSSLPKLVPLEVPINNAGRTEVYNNEGVSVYAMPVKHGSVPALGYVVAFGGKTIVFMGDQNADNAAFEKEISPSSVDLLIAHHSTFQSDDGDEPYFIHRSPRQIGELAAALGAEKIVLAHNFQKSLDRLSSGLAAIEESFEGPVEVADDLSCYAP